MKYQVQFSERLFVTVAVEASSEAEALTLAHRSWRDKADKIEWEEEPAVVTAVPEPAPTPILEVSSC